MSRESRFKKETKKRKEYLSYYKLMTKGGRKPPKGMMSQAQYQKASSAQRQLSKSGVGYKKIKRMK